MLANSAILFTQHLWRSNREAGLHAIGRTFLTHGFDCYFVSAPRRFGFLLGRDSDGGVRNFWALSRGIQYEFGRQKLYNIGKLDWTTPLSRKLFRDQLKFTNLACRQLIQMASVYCNEPSFVIIESCGFLRYFPEIKKQFPNARYIYRPSDPVVFRADLDEELKSAELEFVKEADLTLAVNQLAADYFLAHAPSRQIIVAPNGFHLQEFASNSSCYGACDELVGKNSIGYIGASAPHWDAILAAAKRYPNIDFCVICPMHPPGINRLKIKQLSNLRFIHGIPPEQVPVWTRCFDAIMIPYPDACRNWARGGHSKLYQAIAAGKPTIGLNTGIGSDSFVSIYTNEVDSFVKNLPNVFERPPAKRIDEIKHLSWDAAEARFAELIGLIATSKDD